VKIVVPIKQVPESSNVKMDPETGTVIRAGVETVVNPLDLYALEAALRLKEQYGGTVVAVSMGSAQAIKALKEAVAMGEKDSVSHPCALLLTVTKENKKNFIANSTKE
jgi:electron transfer flavoprotein beta subunit